MRLAVLVLVVYAGLIGLAGWQFERAPTGFIPQQDQGYLITVLQLPPGSSLARTDAVVRQAIKIVLETPGIVHAVSFAGFDGATFTNAPNSGAIFDTLAPFEDRVGKGQTAASVLADLRRRLSVIQDAFIIVIPPPPVRGIGTAGGFKMMIQDKRGRGLEALDAATQDLVAAANQTPGLVGVFSLFNTRTPKLYADIDRVRAEMLGVSADKVFEALQVYIGSAFVNDFNYLGRTYHVTAQADAPFRENLRDVVNLKTRNEKGQMGSHRRSGAVPRHHRTLSGAALQPLSGRRAAGQHAARLLDRLCHRGDGKAGGRAAARRLRLRMDRSRLSGEAGRQHRVAGVRRLGRCSCSWCWRRSTRAGRCRSPSS